MIGIGMLAQQALKGGLWSFSAIWEEDYVWHG
jgi:hypothetical protein